MVLVLACHGSATAQVTVREGVLTAVTPTLRGWKPNPLDPVLAIRTRDEQGLLFAKQLERFKRINYHNGSTGPDPLWQKDFKGPVVEDSRGHSLQRPGLTITQNATFDGIGFNNISPADPTIAVGPSHIIQMVNGTNGSAFFRIFDRAGNALQTQAFMDQLPGASYNGAGDCITWYDQLTNRYVMTEFGDSSRTGTAVNTLVMAVSASDDPLGSWYIYEFHDASFFPDYPKYSNWHDAWYCTTRDFVGSYIGNSVWAFDKESMLRGDPMTSVQRIRLTDPDQKYSSLCPVSVAGSEPAPPGTPGLFLYFLDDDFSAAGNDSDSLGLIGFNVDFAMPLRSGAKQLASIPVSSFRSEICPTRNCAPSADGQGYDVVNTRIMNRPYYRNFGSHESIVANHTVDATGSGVAGLRWYELRRIGTGWQEHQSGTFAPQDPVPCVDPSDRFRFMGAVTINAKGQIAMAYNTSSASGYASIGFTGRNEGDPFNSMSYEETIAYRGTGYGSFGSRWGDYNEIVPDVTDDSVFWFTGMYGASGGWKTRIVSFKLGKPRQLDARLVTIIQPNGCETSCRPDMQPLVTVRNTGLSGLTSLLFEYQVGSAPPVRFLWTGSIPAGNEIVIEFPPVELPIGQGNFMTRLLEVNGLSQDDDSSNDSLSTVTSVGKGYQLPITEGFEKPLYPPAGWTRSSDLNSMIQWEKTAEAAGSGASSIVFNNYDNNQRGRSAEIRLPLLELNGQDSLELSFLFAGAVFGSDNSDTLEVLVSEDCGENFVSVWRRSVREIATREGNVISRFIPALDEWRRIRIDLNPFAMSSQIVVAIRNINGFGNMIYVDDIALRSAQLPKIDAAVAAIVQPSYYTCDSPLEPVVRIQNLGSDTLTSAIIMYSVNDDLSRSMTWDGKLGRREVATITLPGVPLTVAQYGFTASVASPNGVMDENPGNDSLRTEFGVKISVPSPLRESFVSPAFPPNYWHSGSNTGTLSWSRALASYSGIGSAMIRNSENSIAGTISQLSLPLTVVRNADSVFLEFKLSAAGFDPAKPTAASTDTLEIFISSDCGKQKTSVYKKWGSSLKTITDADLPISSDYVPRSGSDWRLERIDLTKHVTNTDLPVFIEFQNHSHSINNIYVDDIALTTKRLPVRLRETGRLVSPNPFQTIVNIQHYPTGATLRGVELFNSSGQQVYKASYPFGADALIQADLGNIPGGLYYLRLTYTDKVVTQKLLKGH